MIANRLSILAVLLSSTVSLAAPVKKNASTKKAPYAAVKEFKAIIRQNHEAFDRCGQAEVLRTKRKVKGTVLIRFIVNGDGKVTESGPVHNTTKSRYIADCLVRNLELLKFPATFGPPVTAAHPFKFDLKK